MRHGIFALITPVITSARGVCVATITCIPAARAICVIRAIAVSTSAGAVCIRSASSSIMTTTYGILSGTSSSVVTAVPAALIECAGDTPASTDCCSSKSFFFFGRALNPTMFRTPTRANILYRRSISSINPRKASSTFFGSVTMGNRRCGNDWYACNSTIFGSITTNRSSSGVKRKSMLAISALMQTLFPLPVVPATSRCGIWARSAMIVLP